MTWPTVAAWARWRAGDGELPEAVERVVGEVSPSLEVRGHVGYGFELAGGGRRRGSARSTLRRRPADRARRPRARPARRRGSSRDSPGSSRSSRAHGSRSACSYEERRRKGPDDIFFLFEDRAYTASEVNERIDNVVRGLISIGVRQGEHVGVLMGTRPSALALVVAISRLGAVAVHAAARRRRRARGRARPGRADHRRPRARALAADSSAHVRPRRWRRPARPRSADTDMEQIDPGGRAPAWYRPNPGRASDVAFIVFTGEGARTRDEPDHQPPVGAVGVRNRVLGGADRRRHRLQRDPAVSPVGADDEHRRRDRRRRAARHGPELRRADVLGGGPALRRDRRLLHVDAAARPRRGAARSRASAITRCGCSSARACRGGCGAASRGASGPARVLEFYASTEAGAILVNLRGAKPGCDGAAAARQRRGADRRLRRRAPASWCSAPTGFARECGVDEVGMLLARVGPSEPLEHDRRCAACSRARTRGSRPATCSAATPTATTGGSTASPT